MKLSSIELNGIYHDGKLGVREVAAMEGRAGCGDTRITYRILSGRVTQEYHHAQQAWVSLIGQTSKCDLASFAAWAKNRVLPHEKDALLTTIAARRLILPTGAAAAMAALAQKVRQAALLVAAGTPVPFEPEARTVIRRLSQKGLVTPCHPDDNQGVIQLTALGAAWIHLHHPE